MNVYIRSDEWLPGENTLGYYNFDDQNQSQITDLSGKGNNLTGGTMPSYSLVIGTNYAGNYANVSGALGQSNSNFGTSLNGDYTILAWVKPTGNGQTYVDTIYYQDNTAYQHQMSIIWGYNSGQFEFYEYYINGGSGVTNRATIKSGANLDTRYLIGYTRNGTSIATYCNGVAGNTTSCNSSSNAKSFYLGSEWTTGATRFPGQIGEFIVENKVWTADDFLNYYNKTKSNYGL